MDKQKQIDKDISVRSKMIEEMSKIMFEKAFENYETSGSAEIDTEVRRNFYSAFLSYCETLYNAGYRKIPENAVVLTEEESVKAWENGNCNAHAIYGLAYKQARKETAEKFAERVNQAINAYRKKVGEDEYVIDARRLIFEVNEICKEFTRREK